MESSVRKPPHLRYNTSILELQRRYKTPQPRVAIMATLVFLKCTTNQFASRTQQAIHFAVLEIKFLGWLISFLTKTIGTNGHHHLQESSG